MTSKNSPGDCDAVHLVLRRPALVWPDEKRGFIHLALGPRRREASAKCLTEKPMAPPIEPALRKGCNMSHDLDFLTGPFRSKEAKENVRQHRPARPRRPIDHAAIRREMSAYFEHRMRRLQIVNTTVTPRGQTIDWIPIESQHPAGEIASPPPLPRHPRAWEKPHGEQPEIIAEAELESIGIERGPRGSVPILRKNLKALGYTNSL